HSRLFNHFTVQEELCGGIGSNHATLLEIPSQDCPGAERRSEQGAALSAALAKDKPLFLNSVAALMKIYVENTALLNFLRFTPEPENSVYACDEGSQCGADLRDAESAAQGYGSRQTAADIKSLACWPPIGGLTPHSDSWTTRHISDSRAAFGGGPSTTKETAVSWSRLGSGRTGFPGALTDGSGRMLSQENILGGTPSQATLRLLAEAEGERRGELKEECSSTESTHQEVRTSPALSAALHNGDRQHEDSLGSGRLELGYLEDERVRVLARIDELKKPESKQEAEMERALLQGEKQAELDQMEAETDIITQLQHKLDELESAIRREKDKERANVEAERRALQSLQEGYAELENQLHNCPESLREQLQEQLKRDGDALETGTKKFEDLEFQQLERESSLEEERETMSQQLLQERAEYHRSVAKRKEKVSALESQANQLGLQASQECERLAKDRTLILQMLQKEKDRLSALEKRYYSLTGGKHFPKSSTAMREVFRSKLDSDPGLSLHQPKPGSVPPLPHGAATLGRNSSSRSPLLAANSTGSLPRNLAATLQDIEIKRQLALQQKGQQVIDEQRRRLAELKQRAAVDAQCQWEALHGSQSHLMISPSYSPIMSYSHGSGGGPPLVHHSILHHHPPSAGEQPYDTLSLESSDSMDTSISTGNNSACSPDNMSSFGGVDTLKIEEMEKMLKEAHLEKARLIESR
ncbi:hypothetical protein KUCAC02_005163, partial [Chaenocephalus aceratus]